MARESTAAWLDDKTRTLDGKSIGRKLFLVRKGERARRAHEAIESMRSFLGEAAELGDDALEEAILDCVFLGVHAYAAQAGTWLDADAWPTAIMMQDATPSPGAWGDAASEAPLHGPMSALAFLALGALLRQAAAAADAASEPSRRERCLGAYHPQTRSDFPALLNCLGLVNEAVEVGVQAGVHASSFLQGWQGKRLRLVDKWSPSGDESGSQMFYVDIANVHGEEVRRQHRSHCEARLAEALRSGRAELAELDSTVAASRVGDGELDFVYLDARHDFAGVVADIHAWWPKVRVGGIFAGHDFVDGEFPEGDFFWISALREVLPGLEGHTHVTQEQNRYPSFFVIKTEEVAHLVPRSIHVETMARRQYAERSRYFRLWKEVAAGSEASPGAFEEPCRDLCGRDCKDRAQKFTPTQTVGSTLRPFACLGAARSAGEGQRQGEQAAASSDVCAAETLLDVQAYLNVCVERCNVTCQQRGELFSAFGADILSV